MAVYALQISSAGSTYALQISSAGSPDVVSLTDGSTYATLEVSAGRGPKGDGWTGVSYSTETGRFTFTSNDGIGYVSDDITVGLDAAVTEAEAAQAAAEAAQAATENIFDQFGDQYLGSKASDPTVDNDGDPLTEGDIYFNTTDGVLKFYSGTAWVSPESIATTAATAAQAAQTAAETAETNAETAETNAETFATNAATSEANAAASASAAATSETDAASSASAAATSETNAATSASASAISATASAGSATASASSASSAAASETAAATSEGNAATSATNAATSAANAATSETNASTSATAAASSASSASASADAALAALDSFDDRYLGPKASDPTVDNDGSPLVTGALYFNTTDDIMKVYEGSVWVAAYASLSGAMLGANNLSDLASASDSRANLGLGTAATTASTDYATAAQGALAGSAVQPNDTPTFAGINTTGNATFGDNDKAIFGAGSDLQIYHDGSNSYVQDGGVGNLYLKGTNLFLQDADGNDFIAMSDGGAGGTVYLKHFGTTRLNTTGTGVDITGTLTSDGLTVDGSASFSGAAINIDLIETNVADENTRFRQNAGNLDIQTVNDSSSFEATRLRVDHSTGDISFYEDTGTTPKFFWDASAEKLGIGTSSPIYALQVGDAATTSQASFALASTTSGTCNIRFGDGVTGVTASRGRIEYDHSDDSLALWTSSSERMRIDSSGNVGIGTSSPSDLLDLSSSDPRIRLTNTGSGYCLIRTGGSDASLILDADAGNTGSGSDIIMRVDNSEKMRIDSSGRVGIGTSSPDGLLGVENTSGAATVNVRGSTDTIVRARQTGDTGFGYFSFGRSSDIFVGGMAYDHGNDNMLLYANNAERMRIDSSGNVGIGTTSPTEKLDVNGTVKATTFSGDGSALTGITGGPPVVSTLNGTGTIALQNATGVSSVTDNGAGKYQFNFSSNFSTATYFAVGSHSYHLSNHWEYLSSNYTGGNLDHTRTTSQCKVGSYGSNYIDAPSVGLMASE